jgi:hypothetical protein
MVPHAVVASIVAAFFLIVTVRGAPIVESNNSHVVGDCPEGAIMVGQSGITFGDMYPQCLDPGKLELSKSSIMTLPPMRLQVLPNGLVSPQSIIPRGLKNQTHTETTRSRQSKKVDLNPKPVETLRKRSSVSAHKKQESKSKTFDGRPAKYMEEFFLVPEMNLDERKKVLTDLWASVADFNVLDDFDGREHHTIGAKKWEILQRYGVSLIPPTSAGPTALNSDQARYHEDLRFVMKLFDVSEDILVNWYAPHLSSITTLGRVLPFEGPNWKLYEAMDHYNWISKAHGFLSTMTAAEQSVVNKLIDNIDKLSTDTLYKLYGRFEVCANMLEEHKKQAAELFQVKELRFPGSDEPNMLESIRGPIQIKDWEDKYHPRRTAERPVDSLARYWIPATDSNHDDWASLAAIKIAHLPINMQRGIRDQVRDLTTTAPSPKELKELYDVLNINWQGGGSDSLRAEASKMLCVRELVFSEQPVKWNWKNVPQQANMSNICTKEERQERLQKLFFIEQWDSDHPDPLQSQFEMRDIPSPASETEANVGPNVARAEKKIDPAAKRVKANRKIEDAMSKVESKLDEKIMGAQSKMEEIGNKAKPVVKDIGGQIYDGVNNIIEKLSGRSSAAP